MFICHVNKVNNQFHSTKWMQSSIIKNYQISCLPAECPSSIDPAASLHFHVWILNRCPWILSPGKCSKIIPEMQNTLVQCTGSLINTQRVCVCEWGRTTSEERGSDSRQCQGGCRVPGAAGNTPWRQVRKYIGALQCCSWKNWNLPGGVQALSGLQSVQA